MKKILAFTVLTAFFALNVVNAQPVTSHNGGKSAKVVSTAHLKNIKKMKDTPDQLMSKKQNTASDNHSASV